MQNRQKLLSVEHFVGIEFLQMDDAKEYVLNLRRLGNFYASKFRYELSGPRADLERAEYYLRSAMVHSDQKFVLLNDLGVLYLEFFILNAPDSEKASVRNEARALFRDSLTANAKQQRAHYNLGVADHAEEKWIEAAKHYKEAVDESVWEHDQLRDCQCSIYYNLGCVNARRYYAEGSSEPALLAEVWDWLNKAAEIGLVREEVVIRDLMVNGDLNRLATDPDAGVIHRIEALKMRLYSGTRKPQLPLSARLKRAYDALRGRL